MSANEAQIMDGVLQKTQSELILFFILVVVALVLVLIPLYRMISKDRKERRSAEVQRIKDETEAANIRQDKYIERERQIIQVVTANTEVMAGLKATLDKDSVTTISTLERVYNCVNESSSGIARIEKTQDQMVSNQREMQDDLNQLLLLVNSLPHTSNLGIKGDIKHD